MRCASSCEPQSLQGRIGKPRSSAQRRQVGLGRVGERADDDEAAVVGREARRHRRQLAAEEQVQEQRLERVVAVVAERDLVAAELARHAVEDAAPQPRAERAVGLPLGDLVGDDGVGVLA